MKNLSIILSVVFFLELGQRIAERFLPIYILALGGSAVVIGFSGALDNFIGAAYAFPGGILSDRIGYKKSLMIFNVVTMLGYLIVILFPSWMAVIFGALLFTSWSSVSLPAIMSAISKVLPNHKQTMGISMHSFIRRFPMALGPILGGILITKWGEKEGVRIAFMISFAFAFFTLLFQHFFIKEEKQATSAVPILHPFKLLSQMNLDLRRLLISDILIRFCEQIPYAFVVVWCMKEIGISAVQFGYLTSIEMVTAILVYIPVAYWVEKKGTKKPFIAITFGFFSLFPVVLLFSRSMIALSFAFFVRGLKEFGEPTRKSLILDFAQGDHQGTLYGGYYMFRDMIVSLAAFLGGAIWVFSPQANFITASLFGLIGLIYFIIYN